MALEVLTSVLVITVPSGDYSRAECLDQVCYLALPASRRQSDVTGVELQAYGAGRQKSLPFVYAATFGVPAVSLVLFRKWRLSSRVLMMVPSFALGTVIGRVIHSRIVYETVSNIDNLPELWPEDQRSAIIARMEHEQQQSLIMEQQQQQVQQQQQEQQQEQQHHQQLQKPSRR
jgi:hypothetical protein